MPALLYNKRHARYGFFVKRNDYNFQFLDAKREKGVCGVGGKIHDCRVDPVVFNLKLYYWVDILSLFLLLSIRAYLKLHSGSAK